jgi:site-specific DNA-methyltransferase (adenine-specific)
LINTIFEGDVLKGLATMPDNWAHTCVTSPPYYGLRDYGVDGQIGLEETPEEFIEKMVMVFREVKRVLRKDGTLWLNMGDSYAGSRKGSGDTTTSNKGQTASRRRDNVVIPRSDKFIEGMKPKDLMGIPWLLAFALRADGWYLRQDIIWHKPNPMPESVRDRCTKAHEYIFLFSKSKKYYYDYEAIMEDAVQNEYANGFRGGSYVNNEPGQRKATGNIKVPSNWDQGDGTHGKFHRDGRSSGNKERKPGKDRGCPEGTGSNVSSHVPWQGLKANKRSV